MYGQEDVHDIRLTDWSTWGPLRRTCCQLPRPKIFRIPKLLARSSETPNKLPNLLWRRPPLSYPLDHRFRLCRMSATRLCCCCAVVDRDCSGGSRWIEAGAQHLASRTRNHGEGLSPSSVPATLVRHERKPWSIGHIVI
jgi:hypothetical protein